MSFLRKHKVFRYESESFLESIVELRKDEHGDILIETNIDGAWLNPLEAYEIGRKLIDLSGCE